MNALLGIFPNISVCPFCGSNLKEETHSESCNAPKSEPEASAPKPKKPSVKEMKAREKIEALRKAGLNVDNLFSMTSMSGEDQLVRATDGVVSVVPDDDPIFNDILNGETINSPQLYRRWVMAQVFRMLATGNFVKALQQKGYQYQWKMVIEELRIQDKLYRNNDDNYGVRVAFFNRDVVHNMAQDYIKQLSATIRRLPRKKCKGEKYIRLGGQNYFEKDIQKKIIDKLLDVSFKIMTAATPNELYALTSIFYQLAKKFYVRYEMPMSASFKDAYKGAGAYYTMQNLILFHDCRFSEGGYVASKEESMDDLYAKHIEYGGEGWRLFGVMKDLIKRNGIDIKKKIAEWRD